MKAYELHEYEYRKMKQAGIKSWFERSNAWSIDPHDLHFLEDVLAQAWAPASGKALEVGCGTGPLLRWICKKGFQGVGIDISPTAIRMAKSATGEDARAVFKVADICTTAVERLGRYDLCIDGRALHCLTHEQDRTSALANIRKLLKPQGIFVVMSMCGPIDRKAFSKLFRGQKIIKDVVLVPCVGTDIDDARVGGNISYAPTRHVAHWTRLLRELRRAGFTPRLLRFNQCTADEPVSSLNVALTIDPTTRIGS